VSQIKDGPAKLKVREHLVQDGLWLVPEPQWLALHAW